MFDTARYQQQAASLDRPTHLRGPSSSLRLALVDADVMEGTNLNTRLGPDSDFELLQHSSLSAGSLNQLTALRPDAVFLDVDTLLSSGVDFRDVRRAMDRAILVMLATQDRFAIQAFELGASDYLLKPISDQRLQSTLERVREHIHLRRIAHGVTDVDGAHAAVTGASRIMVSERRRTRIVQVAAINWIRAAGDYSEIHVDGKSHLLREPLSKLLQRLPSSAFCRIHRSIIVNVERVSDYVTLRNSDLVVRLRDKTLLRASRSFSTQLKRALTQAAREP
jgi:two-component system, LytTR family, response regulator